MEGLVKGDVVVLPFPFSDLSANKRRPAVVVTKGEYGDVILCQITSKPKKASDVVELTDKDFYEGSLKITSYVRPRKIFTADVGLILYKIGRIKRETIEEVMNTVCRAIKE